MEFQGQDVWERSIPQRKEGKAGLGRLGGGWQLKCSPGRVSTNLTDRAPEEAVSSTVACQEPKRPGLRQDGAPPDRGCPGKHGLG